MLILSIILGTPPQFLLQFYDRVQIGCNWVQIFCNSMEIADLMDNTITDLVTFEDLILPFVDAGFTG